MSAFQNKIEFISNYIKKHNELISSNIVKLDVYEGNLTPYVIATMKATLSENYFAKIESRIIPINVLTRVMDKMSKVYINAPNRLSKEQEWVDAVERSSSINMQMGICDTYSQLFKGYLVQPYVDNREIKLRPIPYDRFLPMAEDIAIPEKMTGLVVFMGTITNGSVIEKLFYYYSNTEFIPLAVNGSGNARVYTPALEGNEGVNHLGFIPYTYGNRSATTIIPKQDTDIMQITKMIPVMLSDLGGAIMFQCFSILYGIDVKADNLTMSPNAFWSLKSDSTSDKQPQIGTITPKADIDKVKGFIKEVFALWLETKGVRVGNVGSVDGGNSASGISKIIDEMDVFELKKTSIQYFKKEEKDLWGKLVKLNNVWSKDKLIDTKIIPDDTEVTIIFDEPSPEIARKDQVDVAVIELNNKLKDKKTIITQLNPDLSEQEIEAMILLIENETPLPPIALVAEDKEIESTKNDDQDTKGL